MVKIFISWSKNLSRELAQETKIFLEKVFNYSIEFFFSPDMYKGTCVDQKIHESLLTFDKCLVCITADNFKNPWLLYESGVIYGANYHKNTGTIVVPILFENIPEWSSWVDKPLNRYVPIQINSVNNEFESGKQDFYNFVQQLSNEYNIKINDFDTNWEKYKSKIQQILAKNQLIPTECQDIVYKLMEDSNNFTLNSPEISQEKIYFHKGFTTHALTKILTDNICMYHGKYLWLLGRKNHNLITSREYEPFFEYLATEGLKNGVDFRCFFVHPKSKAASRASSQDRYDIFANEMQIVLKMAYKLKYKYDLPVEKVFRLYKEPRNESITRIDNAVLHRNIIKDSNGYPIPYTNSGFEILSALNEKTNNDKGLKLIEKFDLLWKDEEKSVPLTKELLNELYGE